MRIRRPSGAWGWVAGLALLALASACAPAARYHVLATLFDGVPAPPGVTPLPSSLVGQREGRGGEGRGASATSALARGEVKPKPTPLPIVSVHQPVREHKCRECHTMAGRSGGLLSIEVGLCDKCHREQRVAQGWDHGPINLGSCLPCHVAHESQYPHLLAKPVPEVCLYCHEDVMQRPLQAHTGPDVNDCTKCHNPHKLKAPPIAASSRPAGAPAPAAPGISNRIRPESQAL